MAMLRLRDGRDLEVVETVAEIAAAMGDTAGAVCAKVAEVIAAEKLEEAEEHKTKAIVADKLVQLHEVRRTLLRKFPTPVDTQAEFKNQILVHVVAVDQIMTMVDDVVVDPVHGGQCAMPAVSGPFKHDYDQHVFGDCERAPFRVEVEVPVMPAEGEEEGN